MKLVFSLEEFIKLMLNHPEEKNVFDWGYIHIYMYGATKYGGIELIRPRIVLEKSLSAKEKNSKAFIDFLKELGFHKTLCFSMADGNTGLVPTYWFSWKFDNGFIYLNELS